MFHQFAKHYALHQNINCTLEAKVFRINWKWVRITLKISFVNAFLTQTGIWGEGKFSMEICGKLIYTYKLNLLSWMPTNWITSKALEISSQIKTVRMLNYTSVCTCKWTKQTFRRVKQLLKFLNSMKIFFSVVIKPFAIVPFTIIWVWIFFITDGIKKENRS